MTPASLLLAALLPAADPIEAHDLLVQVDNSPAVRVRLKIELAGKPLAKLDAEVKREREALKGKPGAPALESLTPDGSLLRAAPVPSSPHAAAVSKAIFKALDTDGDGKLSDAELSAADKSLGKLDHDDDECVTPLELVPDLQTVVPDKTRNAIVKVSVLPVEGKADFEQAVKVGEVGHWRGKAGGVWVEVFTRSSLTADKPSAPKSLLGDDRKEAKAVFDKYASGLVTLHAVPGPVGLFDRLDADRDGQLSVAELRRAKAALTDGVTADTAVSLYITPGTAKPPAVPLTRTFTHTAGPDWFRAVDKNGDGFVSRREFLGTSDQFRTLDRDGDSLISPDEADKADKR